jgi:hypothetical protein
LNKYLITYKELETKLTSSVFILYSDINFKYKQLISCQEKKKENSIKISDKNKFFQLAISDDEDTNINENNTYYIHLHDNKNRKTECYENDGTIRELPNEKTTKLKNYGLKYFHNNDDDLDYFFMDNLIYPNFYYDETAYFPFYNVKNVTDFNSYLVDSKYFEVNYYQKKLDNLIHGNNSLINKKKDTLENHFFNANFGIVTFTTFFLNIETDKLGFIVHEFKSEDDLVENNIKYYSMLTQENDDRIDKFSTILGIFLIIVLIIFSYLKYKKKKGIYDLINKCFFGIIFILLYFFDKIFQFYHIIKQTNNAYFHPILIYDVINRDKYLFYKLNINIIKGLMVLSLSFHLIYVIFEQKDIIIIRRMFKRVIIVFFIIIIFFTLTIAIFSHINFGATIKEYDTLLKTFISIFCFTIGIETYDQNKTGSIFDNMHSFTRVIIYIMRLVVMNFVFIIMILIFQKHEKKEFNKGNKGSNYYYDDDDNDEEIDN